MPETGGEVPSPTGPGPNALRIASCSPAGTFRDEVVVVAADGGTFVVVLAGSDIALVTDPIEGTVNTSAVHIAAMTIQNAAPAQRSRLR